jgi:hypothetical protein
MAIACAQLLQPCRAVAPQRLVVIDPLRREQTLDPGDVLHPLGHQPLALAMGAPRVLPRDGRHVHHVAGGTVAAAPGDQRSHQHRRVEPVGLGAPRPPVDLQAAGIHHPAGDPLGREATLQPESVVAGLIADDDLRITAAACLPLARLQATKQGQQARDVAARHPMR